MVNRVDQQRHDEDDNRISASRQPDARKDADADRMTLRETEKQHRRFDGDGEQIAGQQELPQIGGVHDRPALLTTESQRTQRKDKKQGLRASWTTEFHLTIYKRFYSQPRSASARFPLHFFLCVLCDSVV